MEKEELFEQQKTLKEEGELKSSKEIVRDRVEKVKNFLDERSEKIWGLGIKDFYPELSDQEIEDIFYEARRRASTSPGYAPHDMIRAMRGFLESPTTHRKSKFRKYYKEFLYNKFSHDAIDAKEAFEEKKDALKKEDKFNVSMTDLPIQFQLAFQDFFEPIIRKEDLEQKSNELESQLKELGKEFNKVNQDKSIPKDLRKKKGTEIQTNIHALKKEIADHGYDKIEEAEKILSKNFILPNYPLEKLFKDLHGKFVEEHLNKE